MCPFNKIGWMTVCAGDTNTNHHPPHFIEQVAQNLIDSIGSKFKKLTAI
jgi:hypothetical protein